MELIERAQQIKPLMPKNIIIETLCPHDIGLYSKDDIYCADINCYACWQRALSDEEGG